MRKSFTRLFSIFMLFGMILLSAVAFGASPVLSGRVPSDGFSNYDGSSGKLIVTLTFDQNVLPGAQHAGIIGLYKGGQLDPIQISGTTSTNHLTGSTAVISGKTVTVTFNRNSLVQDETYYVTVSGDALMNSSGEYYAGLSNNEYDITIGDFTTPKVKVVSGVKQFTPKDDNNNVTSSFPLASDLSVEFDESIALGTGNIGIYTKDGNVVELIDVANHGGKLVLAGAVLTINPTADLQELKEYYIRIAATAITDTDADNHNKFAGINDNTTWNFQSIDVTAPTAAFVPVNGATNIQQGQIMKINFTDNRVGKVTSGFEVRKSTANTNNKFSIGEDVSSLITFTENGNPPTGAWTAKYTAVNEITVAWGTGANDKFLDHAIYAVGIKANSFYDEEDNLALAASASFTAGDFIAPGMTTLASPAGNGGAPNNVAADKETTKVFLQVTNNDASGYPVEVHYLIVASGATLPTPAQVMAGPVLPTSTVTGESNIAKGFASVDGAGVTLASNTTYDVYFASKDKATVPNTSTQAEVTSSKKSFTTNDIVAPVPTAKVNTLSANNVVVAAGAAAQANVKMDSPVTITFDEDVIVATTNVTVKYWDASLATPAWVTLADGSDYSYSETSNSVTITGAHADIVGYAGALWKSLGQYRVILDNNEITDDLAVKTGTVNQLSEKIYAFNVEDYTGPIAVFNGTSSNNITGVATTANIVVDLGETCTRADGNPIDYNNVFFRDVATGNIVPATITVSGGRYITIDPMANLLDGNAGHNYSIELTASIKDAAGSALGYYKGNTQLVGGATPQMLTFTTGDEQQPALTFVPADGTTGLNDNANGLVINVTINETVKKSNGSTLTASDANYLRTIVSVVKVSDNSPINFDIKNNTATTFDVDLSNFITKYAANESYKVTVNGLYDTAGNLITNNSTIFSIREYTKPTVTAYSPADGSSLVATGAPIKITFSEPVTGVATKLITLKRDDVATTWTFDAATATTISGNVVTLVAGSASPAFPGFAELGTYHVEFPAGCFVDAVGNATDATITNATTWNWSAFDNTAPVVSSLVPADNAAGIVKPTQLVINFTEASKFISAGPGSIYIREMGNTGIPDFTIPAQSASVVITNNIANPKATITVNSANFQYGKTYWVEVDATAFRDGANNYFAGLVNDNTLWNFTIEADPKPFYVVAQSSPKDDANDVDLNAALTIKFSEPVWFAAQVGKYLTIRNADATAHHTVYFDSPSVTWSWNNTHDELTVQHPDFLADKDYYITITSGTFKDAANQLIDPATGIGELDGAGELNFTTTDLTSPVVSAITVNSTNVSSSLGTTPTGIAKDGNILVTFSEPVVIASGDLNSCVTLLVDGVSKTYVGTLSGNVLTINPDADFAQANIAAAVVDVNVVANKIKDLATTPLYVAAGAIGKFVVVDYNKPLWDESPITAASANNGFSISNVGINEAGKIYYYAVPAGSLSATPSAATIRQNSTGSKTVVAADNTLVISGLLGDTAYDLYFIAEDAAGNLMDGTSTNQTVLSLMNERTSDNVAPLLLTSYSTSPYTAGLSPADNATCVATNTTLNLKFNEDVSVVGGTSKFWVRKVSDNYSVAISTVAAVDDVVTITLASELEDNTEYYVEINPGAIVDAAVPANAWATYFYGNGVWNFKTEDSEAPVLATTGALTPADGATAVGVGANNALVIKFNEPIFKNVAANTFIDIYRAGSATPHERIDVSTDAVTVSGNTVTINRSNVYASETDYYVLIPSNSFYDGSCDPNYFAGFSLNTDWNFKSADITAPTVAWNPDGTAVVNSTVFTTATMTVNENLYNGATAITNGTDLKARFSVVSSAGAVSVASAVYNNKVITITLNPATLASNSSYTISYSSSSTVADQAGNVVPSSSVTFNTEDRLSPVVTISATQVNAANPAEVLVGTKFRVTFDKKVLKTGGQADDNVTPTATDLKDASYLTMDGSPFLGSVSVVTPGLVYELTPSVTLASKSTHEFVWTANASTPSTVKDELYFPNGNVLDRTLAQRTFTFTTEDVDAPVLSGALAPLNVSVNLNAPLNITFNEKVAANDAAGQIEIRYSNGQIFEKVNPSACDFTDVTGPGYTVVIPHAAFEAYRNYYVVVPAGAFTDVSFNKNAYAGFMNNTTWTFSTGDATAPYVLTYSPLQNEQNVIVDANLVLTFSENIQLGTGNLVIYHNNGAAGADGNAIEIIPFNSPKVTISGTSLLDPAQANNVVTINPAMTFNALGEYYVRIDNGFVKDAAGNDYAGINNNSTWKFGITDPTPPTLLLASNPVDDETNVKAKLNGVSMQFDRDVLPGTGSIKLYQYNYNASTYAYETKLIETIDVNSVSVNHATNTVTFDVAASLADNSVYYFLANNGSFTNTATSKNWWTGINDPFAWRFTTGDNSAPSVISSVTVDPVATPNVFDVILTFSENVSGVDASSITVTGGTMVLSTVTAGLVYKATVTAADLAEVVLSVSNAIKDANNNPLTAANFTYKVADNNAPTLTSLPNGGNVDSNVFTVNLTFNEPVKNVASAVSVNNGATVVVTGTGAEYQVVVTSQSNTSVTLSVSNAVLDMVDHPFAGASYIFNISGSQEKPVVSVDGLNPADGSIGVIRRPELSMTFMNPIVKGDANAKVKVYKQDVSNTNNLVFEGLIDASMISADGMKVTVPVSAPLSDFTDYVVLVDAGLVKSQYGILFDGITNPVDWNFRTGDNTAPVVLSVTPETATAAKNSFNVAVEFSEEVVNVAENISVTNGTSTVTKVTSTNYLVAIQGVDGAVVTMTIGTGVKDASLRNSMTDAVVKTYTIGDNTAPTVVITPAAGNTMKNTFNVALQFNEDVVGVESGVSVVGGSGTVTGSGSSYLLTVSNAVDMSTVTVTLANSIKDLAGNAFVGSVNSYKVGDNTAPEVIATPSNGATNLKSDFQVTLTFNENVVVPNGAITVVGAGSSSVTNQGSVYTVNVNGVTDNSDVVVSLNNTITDVAGNEFVAKSFTYKTGDNTAPVLVATPASGEKMDNTFNVFLEFNEVVTNVSSAIKVTGNNGTPVVVGSGKSYNVSITAADFANVKLVVDNTIKDSNGNNFAGAEFTYTVGDHTGPIVADNGFTPADGSKGLGSSISLFVTFNEELALGSSSAMLRVYKQDVSATNSKVWETAVTAAMISGKTLTVPVAISLEDNTAYTVLLDKGLVRDLSGNDFLGFTDPTRWNFETGDNTAPTVVSVTPSSSSNATNTFQLAIVFSEDVVNVTSNVSVTNGTVTVTGSGNTYTATVKAEDGAVVVMTIGTGIKDSSLRNSLANAVAKTYTVGDNTSPKVVVTPPATPVATVFKVGLKFNEPVTGVANGVIVSGGTLTDVEGTVDTYTLTISAVEQKEVTIELTDGIKDISPNANKFAGQTLKYTTGDFTAPSLVSWTPLDETTTNNHPTFKMTFNEDVAVGTGGALKVYKVATTTPVLTIPVTAAMINGKEVTVSYAATQQGLDKDARYYVLVEGTALKDKAGNAFIGVSDNTAWTFKTGPVFATGIDPIVNGSLEFKVYPNPFVDYVNVKNASELSKIVVTNIAGQTVKEVVNPTERIQLNELRSGYYFMTLYNADDVVVTTVKIVKR